MSARPTALVADDEPLLREALVLQLARAWPELEIVAQARNGREAIERFDALAPDICFLDVHMPGLNGIDAARHVARRAHVVFVTAFDRYAVQAFDEGALDYLVKPVEPARLADTVARLKARLAAAPPAALAESVLAQFAELLQAKPREEPLRWLRAQSGTTLRLIAVEDIDYLRADTKYTRIAWRDAGRPTDALVRIPLKDLLPQLDPQLFAQVHRAVVVNMRAIAHVVREDDAATIHLRDRPETVPVSRSWLHLFKQM